MKRVVTAGFAAFAVCALLVPPSSVAQASIGKVAVFASEEDPVRVFENPRQCNPLPLGAHVLVNLTTQPVKIHGDPRCLTPGVSVKPGYGSHVSPAAGSFSV